MTNLSKTLGGGLILSGAVLFGAFSASAVVNVPGDFKAGDLDATEGSYLNAQFIKEGATLKNDYKENPDVKVRITRQGQIGNTSPGDYFTYTLNVAQDGVYKMISFVSCGENSEGKYTLTIDGGGEGKTFTESFTGTGFNNYTGIKTEGISLTEGEHTLKFTVDKGLNFRDVNFILPMVVDLEKCNVSIPGSFNGGDLTSEESWHQEFEDGKQTQNQYAKNPDARARILENGKIGNITGNKDYFTYYFNATKGGVYTVYAIVEGPNTPKFKMTFDQENVIEGQFEGAGWNNTPIYVNLGEMELSEGGHQLKFEPLSGLNLYGFNFDRVRTLDEISLAVPGKFLGGDIDAEDYRHQQFAAQKDPLKNDYKGNPDVAARIDGNGKLGNLSANDYFNYYFNVTKGGNYHVTITVQGDGSNDIKNAITLNDGERQEFSFTPQGWSTNVDVKIGEYELEEGINKMRLDIMNGMNVVGFSFTRDRVEADANFTVPEDIIIPGMLDKDNGSYRHKHAETDPAAYPNKYAQNPTVAVKISPNGEIQNSDPGDFYTYTIICSEEGHYQVEATVQGSKGERNASFIFDNDEENAISLQPVQSEGWDNTYTATTTGHVALTEGLHTMKALQGEGGGMHFKQFRLIASTVNAVEGIESETSTVDVYSIDGVLLKSSVERENALEGLAKGLYIVGGKKMVK